MTLLFRLSIILFFISLPIGAFLLYFEPWGPFFGWETLAHTWSLGMIFGILVFSAVVTQFFLGSRIKLLDRAFGQDKVIRFHGFLGLVILLGIGGHVISKNLSTYELNLQVFLGMGAGAMFNTIIVLSALLMSPVILARWSPLVELRRWTAHKLRLRYNTLRLVHNLVSVAGILAVIHVLLASSTSENELRMGYMLGWFVVGFGFYLYHRLIKGLFLRARPWTVSAVREESPAVVSVTLQAPAHFDFRAGQFVYVSFQQKGFPSEEHPFTLASAPGAPLTITAKKSGVFTARLGELAVGSRATIDGPYGLFTLRRSPPGLPVVFLAGGIGITPFLSMLRSLRDGFDRDVQLIWNTSRFEDAFAHDELKKLASGEKRFSYTLLLSREDHPEARRARLTPKVLSDLVDISRPSMYYLCGPVAQMESLVKELLRQGVRPARIVFERFSY